MLVLSRKTGETILAGEIKITVLAARPGKVRIAIDAPREVKVLRGELLVPKRHTAAEKAA